MAPSRRRWWVLILLCVGQLMIVLDGTVVNVALPVIEQNLHFTQASVAWVVNSYLLTFGGLLLLAGRIGDLVGRTRIFLIGLAAFSVSSLVCGLSPSASILVTFRFIQGASAALIAAMVLGIISTMFPDHSERTKAFSVFATVSITGMSLGLLLGGAVTQLLSWHWVFIINVPVGTVLVILGSRLLERDPGLGIRAGADLLGAVFVTGAPVLVVYGLINAGLTSWSSKGTVISLVGSAVVGGLFVFVESRVKTPLIPLRLFNHRTLVCATVVRILLALGGYGLLFLGALYMQHVLGYSPLRTGLAFLPISVITAVISLAVNPLLVRRFGPRILVLLGQVMVTVSFLILCTVSLHTSFYPTLLLATVAFGIGNGFFFMPSITIAMTGIGDDEAGVASGLTNVAVQLGGSIGLAALATISASRSARLMSLHEATNQALTGGYKLAFLVSAVFTTVSLVVALVLLRPAQRVSALEIPVETSSIAG